MPTGENKVKIAAPLLALLRAGSLVLTPSQRAARTLHHAFNHAMQAEGLTQWPPASVLALDTWLTTLWHQLQLHGDEQRLLLNRTQQHALWQAILAADPEVSGLRSPDLLAEMAATAWSTVCLHRGRPRLREFAVSADTKAFQRWALEFDRRCQRAGFLTLAQLPEALEAAVAATTLPLPPAGLTLLDFDELPPAHDDLLTAIDRAGYPVARLQTSQPATRRSLTAADDPAELESIAHWCRRHLEQDPALSIAVVVPNLADRRHEIDRTFARILAPAALPITAPAQPPLFEFSLGIPLAETGACLIALDLLRWSLHPLPLEAVSALLLSPFAGADRLAAADFDAHTLRQTHLLRPELTLEAFLDLAAPGARGPHCPPALLAQLRALRRQAHAERLHDPAAQATFEDWSEAFRNVLDAAGWVAATSRDALNRQVRQRFESALDELATLDFDSPRPTAPEALRQLTRIAQQTIFAPESSNAPVQILGPLELGAVPFDHLWFLSADDLTWPPALSTSPLIPWAIQQSLGVPGADPARDRRQARALTRRIAAAAPHVVFSFAVQADEGTRRRSPLLDELDLAEAGLPPPPEPPAAIPLLDHLDLEPIAQLPPGLVQGGASILQAQAACPFRAFAEKRLRSAEPQTTQSGLDPRDRGSIVHTVMEHFWRVLGTQAALLALPATGRASLLDDCIAQALDRIAARARSPWDLAYMEVQRRRLRNLLDPWLDFEAGRPTFQVLEHEREETGLPIGPLQLKVRIDRIDQTADGGLLILDYKTGEAKPSEWLTERPDQPQLPLYAVLAETQPVGLAFALLRPGDGLKLTGFAASDEVFAKPSRNPLSLEAQLEDWHRVLSQLADDFADGRAQVDPKCFPKTCAYCTQRILCRLDPATLEDVGDDPENEPSYA